jgi:putative tricarboxylic transport membrane protein
MHNSVFDVGLTLGFGVLGYIFRKLDLPMAPMILTVIVGPMMERALRQTLDMSRGDFSIFFTRPISIVLIILAVALFVSSLTRTSKVVKEDSVV